MTRPLLLLLALLPMIAFAGVAETPHSLIRDAVVKSLGGAVRPQDVAISPQTRVAACRQPLTAVPANARTVEVRCGAPKAWRIFVPVRVVQVRPVVVLSRAARAGVPLAADQLAVQERDMAAVVGAGFDDPAVVAGKVPKRGMPPGAVVRQSDLADAMAVKRGDQVTLVSTIGGISVRAHGVVTGSAAVGGQVSAENLSSKRIVRGRLIEPGIVEIGR